MEPRLIVGLSQGLVLRSSRHAIGSALLTEWAAERGLRWRLYPTLGAYIAEHARADGGRTLLVFPLVAYNLSGVVVAAAARRFGVANANVAVMHDDLDCKVGTLKWRYHGTAGGNGVKSIIAALGTDAICRLRLGIGRPADKSNVISHVLGTVPPADMNAARAACAAEDVAKLLLDGVFSEDKSRGGATPTGETTGAASMSTSGNGSSSVAGPLAVVYASLLGAYLRTARVALRFLCGGLGLFAGSSNSGAQ